MTWPFALEGYVWKGEEQDIEMEISLEKRYDIPVPVFNYFLRLERCSLAMITLETLLSWVKCKIWETSCPN